MNYTLITGASRGIGNAMARYCAGKKYNLILVARSEEKLNELALSLRELHNVDVKVYVGDLSDTAVPPAIFNWCKDNNLKVDILINNVGMGLYGKAGDLSLQEQLNLMQLNLMSTVAMTCLFIPMLKQQERSYILNISSTACFQPIPYMSVYAASQSFIHSFTLGIREELKNNNVHVSCLCPGPTATDFFDRSGLEALPVNSDEIKMSSTEVAEAAIEGLLDNVAEIIPGTSNTIGAYFSKLFPNKMVLKTVAGLFAPKS